VTVISPVGGLSLIPLSGTNLVTGFNLVGPDILLII
jgi:hypothetical protein